MNILADPIDAETYAALLAGEAGEFDLVCLERPKGGERGAMAGLDDALSSAEAGRAVVMVARREPYEDPRWHAAMGHPNVAFRRHGSSREEILEGFEETKARRRPADPLAIHVWKVRGREQAIVGLRYELYAARGAGEEAMDRWDAEARRILGDMTREKLIALISDRASSGRSPVFDEMVFPPEEFPDVCVDFLRTLCEGSSIREEVHALVTRLSLTRPITVWTGGDIRYAETVLRQNGIPWKIMPRPVTSEIRVAVIVDDQTEDEFRTQQPLVAFREYIQV